MAAASSNLQAEVTCSICLDFFTDPVTIDCGHTFCLHCITEHIKKEEMEYKPPICPECRQLFRSSNLKPNKRMTNIVEMIQQPEILPTPGPVCAEHGERLLFFCQTDETTICVVCRDAHQHRNHRVAPIQEAVQNYKPLLLESLAALKTHLEKVQRLMINEDTRLAECQGLVSRERQKIVSEFEDLQRFLKEQQDLLLHQLDEKEKLVLMRTQRKVIEMEDLQSSLQKLVREIEFKCQQPDVEFLKDTGCLLTRCEEVKEPEPSTPSPEEAHLQSFHQQHVNLMKMIKDFQEWRRVRCFAVNISLDPETAHPYLMLSDDLKSVNCGVTGEVLPESPKRFSSLILVLGSQGFGHGRHYWEVEVGDKTDWGLGLCRKSVKRKEKASLLPKDGYWGVWLVNRDSLWALTSTGTQLNPRVNPQTIGVFLDYEVGKISFYNAEDRSLLFTFEDTFNEDLYPYFTPCQPQDGKNTGALTIHNTRIRKSEPLVKVL
ncbi:E3 ubiquitin-protein ligase TRIM39-like [Pleurodeles waltl]